METPISEVNPSSANPVQNLIDAFNALSWWKKLLFPPELKKALRSNNAENNMLNIILAFLANSWWFPRYFFKCIQTFARDTQLHRDVYAIIEPVLRGTTDAERNVILNKVLAYQNLELYKSAFKDFKANNFLTAKSIQSLSKSQNPENTALAFSTIKSIVDLCGKLAAKEKEELKIPPESRIYIDLNRQSFVTNIESLIKCENPHNIAVCIEEIIQSCINDYQAITFSQQFGKCRLVLSAALVSKENYDLFSTAKEPKSFGRSIPLLANILLNVEGKNTIVRFDSTDNTIIRNDTLNFFHQHENPYAIAKIALYAQKFSKNRGWFIKNQEALFKLTPDELQGWDKALDILINMQDVDDKIKASFIERFQQHQNPYVIAKIVLYAQNFSKNKNWFMENQDALFNLTPYQLQGWDETLDILSNMIDVDDKIKASVIEQMIHFKIELEFVNPSAMLLAISRRFIIPLVRAQQNIQEGTEAYQNLEEAFNLLIQLGIYDHIHKHINVGNLSIKELITLMMDQPNAIYKLLSMEDPLTIAKCLNAMYKMDAEITTTLTPNELLMIYLSQNPKSLKFLAEAQKPESFSKALMYLSDHGIDLFSAGNIIEETLHILNALHKHSEPLVFAKIIKKYETLPGKDIRKIFKPGVIENIEKLSIKELESLNHALDLIVDNYTEDSSSIYISHIRVKRIKKKFAASLQQNFDSIFASLLALAEKEMDIDDIVKNIFKKYCDLSINQDAIATPDFLNKALELCLEKEGLENLTKDEWQNIYEKEKPIPKKSLRAAATSRNGIFHKSNGRQNGQNESRKFNMLDVSDDDDDDDDAVRKHEPALMSGKKQ